jgi:hypothetical protein
MERVPKTAYAEQEFELEPATQQTVGDLYGCAKRVAKEYNSDRGGF